jgi:hypothetical protein
MRLLGIPLTAESVTDEFRDFINDKSSRVLVMSSVIDWKAPELSWDYRCAQIGFDYVRNSGYEFVLLDEFNYQTRPLRHVVMLPLWYDLLGVRQTPQEVAAKIDSFARALLSIGVSDVTYITQGSPYLHDAVSRLLIRSDSRVLDATSSATLAFDAVRDFTSLPMHIPTDLRRDGLLTGHANVLGSVGSHYILGHGALLDDLNLSIRAWAVSLGNRLVVEEIDPIEIADAIRSGSTRFNATTFVIEM